MPVDKLPLRKIGLNPVATLDDEGRVPQETSAGTLHFCCHCFDIVLVPVNGRSLSLTSTSP